MHHQYERHRLLEACGYCHQSSIHHLMVFTIKLEEALGFITQRVIEVPLHAIISNEQLG